MQEYYIQIELINVLLIGQNQDPQGAFLEFFLSMEKLQFFNYLYIKLQV